MQDKQTQHAGRSASENFRHGKRTIVLNNGTALVVRKAERIVKGQSSLRLLMPPVGGPNGKGATQFFAKSLVNKAIKSVVHHRK